ncbi:uncharacterized protein LOC115980178 [Quercus lobata]|uniref:uncharacterized protein LOC115980178 n=1 Tax=Quercus lobata TaxID=97700 RepID=UPI00124486F8|nr:uncharacterized protein LOC115980178 [Quercus lobata]
MRATSSGAVPPPPSSTGVDTAETLGTTAADADVPSLTTSNDSDIQSIYIVEVINELQDELNIYWSYLGLSLEMFQSLKWIFVIGNSQLSNFLRHIAKVRQLWQRWNLRSFILFSIVVQIFLLFTAPLRKETANKAFIIIIWAAYLIADWAAGFAVGLIFDSEEKYTASGAINNTVSFLVTKNHGIFSTVSSRTKDDTGLLLMWTLFYCYWLVAKTK